MTITKLSSTSARDTELFENASGRDEFAFNCVEIVLKHVSRYLEDLLSGDEDARSGLEAWPTSTALAIVNLRSKGTPEERQAQEKRFVSILDDFKKGTFHRISSVESTKLFNKNAQQSFPFVKIKEEPLEIKEEVKDEEDDYSQCQSFMADEGSPKAPPPEALSALRHSQQEQDASKERSRKRTMSGEDKINEKCVEECADQIANKRPKEEIKKTTVHVQTETKQACTCQCRGCEVTRADLPIQSSQVQVASGVPTLSFRTQKCIICLGNPNSNGILNGKKLDFTNKFQESCYHYAMCYYDTGKYFYVIPPGENNEKDGTVKDHMGKEVTYSCDVPGCQERKGCGYRAYFMHMATKHGKLEDMLEADDRPGKELVLEMVRRGRNSSTDVLLKPKLRCKVKGCRFESPKQDLEELKRHYALDHLKAYFTETREDGKPPRVRQVEDENKGVLCKLCGSDVRVKGSTDDVIFHLAVKHDKLRSALQSRMRASFGSEYNSAFIDLYPKYPKS